MANSDIGEKESLIKVTSLHPINSWIHKRGKWGCQTEYYLAVLSTCFSLQGFYMLPFLLWYGGGISFLLPFFLITVLVGIPMFYLQASLGQASGAGLISIFNICPLLKGFGYASWFYNFLHTGTSVSVLLYACYYLWMSFTSLEMPWKSCNNAWNTHRCGHHYHDLTESPAGEYFTRVLSARETSEHPRVITPLIVFIVIVWALIGLVNSRGIRWIGKLSYVTVLLPILLLAMLTIRGLTLPGAFDGVYIILNPDWQVVLSPQFWIMASTLQFYLFGGGGILLTLSSYNHYQNNLKKDMIFTFLWTVLLAVLCILFTGSFLGYLINITGMSKYDFYEWTDKFMFVDIVTAVTTIPSQRFWFTVFFLTIVLFEFGRLALIFNTLTISLLDELPGLRNYKARFNYVLCLILAMLSLPYSVYGLFKSQFSFSFISITIEQAILLLQLLLIVWAYGQYKLQEEFFNMYHKGVLNIWFFFWKVVTPVILFLFLVHLISLNVANVGYSMNDLPTWVSSVAWILDIAPFIFVIFYAIDYTYWSQGFDLFTHLKNSWKPISLGPTDAEEFEEEVQFSLTDNWNDE